MNDVFADITEFGKYPVAGPSDQLQSPKECRYCCDRSLAKDRVAQ